jgi:hypothetical protein
MNLENLLLINIWRSSTWRFWIGFILFILVIPLIPFAVSGELPGESWVEHPNSFYVFCVGIIVLGGDILLPIPSS